MLTSFVGIKGGSGKTLIAVHYAVWMHDNGKSVAVLDCDPQHSAKRWLAEVCPELEVAAIDPQRTDVRREIFDKATEIEDFDEIVCDGPAFSIEHTRAILTIADFAVIPSGPSAEDLHVARRTLKLAEQTREKGRKLPLATKIVLTRIVQRSHVGRDAIEAASSICRVANSIISQRSAFADSIGQGNVVSKMGSGAQKAAEEMQSLCRELFKWPARK